MEESGITSDDLKTIISLDSPGKNIIIKHELDEIRNYDMIKVFYSKIKNYLKSNIFKVFDSESYQKKVEFLISLCPLTISFYLKLGLEIDFGIGVEKPIDRKQMARFLFDCNEAINISN